jgi:hypothetical protein
MNDRLTISPEELCIIQLFKKLVQGIGRDEMIIVVSIDESVITV